MITVLSDIMRIGSSILEVWLCYEILFLTVLEKEYLRKRDYVIIWSNILILGYAMSINRQALFFSHTLFALSIFITVTCVSAIKRNAIASIAMVVILAYAIMALLDFFFAFLSLEILKQQFEQIVFLNTNSMWQSVIFLCSRVIMFFLIIWIKKKNKDYIKLSEYRHILFLMCLVFVAVVLRYQVLLADMSGGFIENKGGLTSLSLLGSMSVTGFAGAILFKYKMMEKENDFFRLHDEMNQQNYSEIEKIVEQNQQLIHDIKNHFLVLQEYEKSKNYEGIREYLNELSIQISQPNVYTGNKVIDFMLNKKGLSAEQKGVKICIQAIPVDNWGLNESETCSLFGNLLDNALEACERVEQEKRWIAIRIERQQGMLFLKISNSIAEKPVEKNGNLVSSKKDKRLHGYGIKSVKRIVEKYDGTISYQVKEQSFEMLLGFFDMEGTS